MIAVTDPFMTGVRPSGLQRGRGGFLRSADDAPYVTDPSGDLVKTGERRGEVKRIKYGSPSGVGRLIENDVGLTKFKQRNTLLGIGMDDGLREACKALVDMEAGSTEFRNCADLICVEADRLTRSWLAADRGSHGHLVCQRVDEVDDFLDLIEAGEGLGIDKATQLAVAHAWDAMLRDNGLEVLAIEAPCVDDQRRLAGTLDRLVRTTRPLRFVMPGGEIVDVPAGIVVVLDIKFGAPRRAHLIQIASYAQSVPYDTDTETRGEWPWPIDQTHALIAHGDFGGDDRPVTIELMWVDLAAGRDHGGACVVDAKSWSGRDDLWSVAQLDVGEVPEPIGDGVAAASPATPVPEPVRSSVASAPGSGTPDVEGGDSAEVAAPPVVLANAAPPSTTFDDYVVTPPDRLALVDARASLAVAPEQGADLSDLDAYGALYSAIRAEYDALDPASRSWIAELSAKATRQNLSFHTVTCRTERSYHIARGLVALATAEADDTEILRALLALVVGDVALFPGCHPGHVLGSLSATEAERWASLVDTFNQPGLGLRAWVDLDGTFRLREVSPA